jgi:flagellar motor switch protein FliN/FliY
MKLGNVKDVKVELSVELGRAKRSLAEMAGIGEGTIIELDRLAGESVDLFAAGELIAKAEVVVIDESFGVRVTELLKRRGEA